MPSGIPAADEAARLAVNSKFGRVDACGPAVRIPRRANPWISTKSPREVADPTPCGYRCKLPDHPHGPWIFGLNESCARRNCYPPKLFVAPSWRLADPSVFAKITPSTLRPISFRPKSTPDLHGIFGLEFRRISGPDLLYSRYLF